MIFYQLEDNLHLFSQVIHEVQSILKDQKIRSQQNDDEMLKNPLCERFSYKSRDALESGDTIRFGELMRALGAQKSDREA